MPFVIGFAGFSDSGKTTLIEQVIPLLRAQGLRVSLIKHAHHNFDIDVPGKDSYRHRQAGAHEVLITSAHRWALLHELRGATEPTLDEQLARLSPCDLVIVEGFKFAPIPKIEVYRPSHGKDALWPHDPHIVAIATDAALSTTLPQLDINQPQQVVTFILSLKK
ncbi:MAG: molybdopterin-guanine dinucleotide biosynthesis protein B [Burkholderiaceae bacterium]|nr:MAG: molybdopterin-guanine dinucleotide biosynthesis protein B [Burkholderiaceae bacterium]